jgi:integrase
MPIRKRHDRWEVRVQIDGRRIEETLPAGATRADAKQVEARYRRSIVDQRVGRKPQRTIADALDEWEATGARALRSWATDLRYRANAVRVLAGSRPLEDLPALASEIRQRGLAAKSSPANINRHLTICKRLANLAVKWQWTDSALGQRIDMVPGERSRDLRLTREQVRKLMSKAEPRLADFVLFLALTGLRRSEALRLTPDDIVNGCVRVDTRSKSARLRMVPLAPEAAKIARRAIPFDLTIDSIEGMWGRAREATGMPDVWLTDLRHFFGTQLVARGTDAATVRDLMGHSSLAVTSRYVQAVPAAAVRAVKGLSVRGHSGAVKSTRHQRSRVSR